MKRILFLLLFVSSTAGAVCDDFDVTKKNLDDEKVIVADKSITDQECKDIIFQKKANFAELKSISNSLVGHTINYDKATLQEQIQINAKIARIVELKFLLGI